MCQVLYMPVSQLGRVVGYEALCSEPTRFRRNSVLQYRHDVQTAAMALSWLREQRLLSSALHWVSFNLAPSHLMRPDLLSYLTAIYDTHPGLPPGALCLEILETEPLVPGRQLRQQLVYLRRLGLSIALDDVGTGHFADPAAILQLLRQHHGLITRLKFAPSAWSNLVGGAWAEVASFARSHGMSLVAEGVQANELTHVHRLGLLAQGDAVGLKSRHPIAEVLPWSQTLSV